MDIIGNNPVNLKFTEQYKLADIHPDFATMMASKLKMEVDKLQLIRKGYTQTKSEVSTDERAIVSYINTAGLDRDFEIVHPKGAILDDFLKNPVVMWAHDYRIPPIGRCQWVKSDKVGLRAKTMFWKSEFADQIYRMYVGDEEIGGPLLRAWSIGFIPIKWEQPTSDNGDPLDTNILEGDWQNGEIQMRPRKIYTKWIMLEYSAVPIPSNPGALALGFEKCLITSKSLKSYFAGFTENIPNNKNQEPEENEVISEELYQSASAVADSEIEIKPYPNEHACRHRDPNDFTEGSFRSTEREHEGKKYRVIMGKLKDSDTMTVQAFRYPKDVWKMSDARKHCKEHGGKTFEAASNESSVENTININKAMNISPEKYEELKTEENPLIASAISSGDLTNGKCFTITYDGVVKAMYDVLSMDDSDFEKKEKQYSQIAECYGTLGITPPELREYTISELHRMFPCSCFNQDMQEQKDSECATPIKSEESTIPCILEAKDSEQYTELKEMIQHLMTEITELKSGRVIPQHVRESISSCVSMMGQLSVLLTDVINMKSTESVKTKSEDDHVIVFDEEFEQAEDIESTDLNIDNKTIVDIVNKVVHDDIKNTVVDVIKQLRGKTH